MMPQDPEDIKNETEQETPQEEEAGSPEPILAEAEEKAREYMANWQRAQADFINYKRRTEQERQEFSRFASAEVMRSLLPILDDLDRALGSELPPELENHGWLEGIKMVDRKLRATLEAQGLAPVKALGEPFDPNFHEAVRQAKGKEGIVVDEFQKGYMMYDRLLRPSKVVVGNGSDEDGEEAPSSE